MLNADMWGAAYLIIVRAGVLTAGIVSIVCGYRLFLAGVFNMHPKTPVTEVSGRFSGAQFTLKSAAPGTCFAFFGALIVVAMILSAPPRFELTRTPNVSETGIKAIKEELRMRGDTIGIEGLVEQAKHAEHQGNKKRAIEGYESALRVIAEPLNNLAWLYHEAGREREATSLARLATQFAPDSAEFADTLKKVCARDCR